MTDSKIKYTKIPKYERQSPDESATLYRPGTKLRGNNGQIWVVKKTKRGINKWIIDKSLNIKVQNDKITSFNINDVISLLKCGKPQLIGMLDITSNKIGIGELFYQTMPATSGTYRIYEYCGNLLAIYYKDSILDQKFILTNKMCDCDIGMYSYNDHNRISKYFNKSSKSKFGIKFPDFNTKIFNKVNYDYIYESDLEKNKNINTNNNPIAIFSNNYFGDGSFPIYRSGNNYWIMNYDTIDKIISLII
ncbi:hypothetical protein [Powai lake megavirus]|uniref:Uncharacterized protein n=1 Tax=Powai lake megavirus TaxID=1842663 RepID=A0A167RLC0_9VIRU|nr:hypothetical protein QJ849_gp662 [Powai lake megavirus]ANB50824.1 hypothetical protein [Powai lake megavirus]